MGKYVQWITHQGTKILFVDIASKGEAETIAAYEEMKQELLKERSGPPVMIDLSNTPMTTNTHNKAKEAIAFVRSKGIPEGPSSVVGLTSLQKAVAKLFGKGVYFANNAEEAKAWLVKENNKKQKH